MAKAKVKKKSKSKAASKSAKKSRAPLKKKAVKAKKAAPSAKIKKPNSSAKKPAKISSSVSSSVSEFISPLDDRLIVELVKPQQVSPAGLILLSEASASEPQEGRVMAIGRGHKDKKGKLRPMDVKVGDRVLFTPYSGSKLKLMQQEVQILRESEVLGIIEN